jgi:diacylglycerol kinase
MVKQHIVKVGFHHAWNGIKQAYQHYNFKIHLIISAIIIPLALLLQIPILHFSILIVAITFGLVVEMLNTAIEATVDLVTEEWHHKAKIAKDVAAGAMLITAIGSSLLGLLILGPPLLATIGRL